MADYHYSDEFLWHLENTLNVGTIKNPDGFGEARSETSWCGDVVRVTLKVNDGVIEDIKFRVYGCAAVIAGGSLATEMAKGKSLEEAYEITVKNLCEVFGKIRWHKRKCLGTVLRALRAAIDECRSTSPPYPLS